MKRIALVDGYRTPFVKAGTKFANLDSKELGLAVVQKTVNSHKVDELIFSTVLHDPRRPNIAREIALAIDPTSQLNSHTVSNNCISGLLAVAFAADGIKAGRINSAIAGGVEAMSKPALLFSDKAAEFFLRLNSIRNTADKIKFLFKYRPKFALPVPPSPKEPSTGLTMGQHCELMAKEFGIARDEQDKLAFESHQGAAKGYEEGLLGDELVSVAGVEKDTIVRPSTTVAKLSELRTVFDRSSDGTLTAGNSSALTDGASAVVLMSEDEASNRGLTPKIFIEDIVFTSISPADGLLMAPALGLPILLERNGLSVADIDIFEIHEAFAAQVLCTLKAWKDGWNKYPTTAQVGEVPAEKINILGGSLALGHPFAATGGRLLLSASHALKKVNGSKGVLSVCAAGGMGCVALVSSS